MSANFSSDSIVWVDGKIDRSMAQMNIFNGENCLLSKGSVIVDNVEVKIVNSAAYAMNNLKKAKDKEAA